MGAICFSVGAGVLISYATGHCPKMAWLTAAVFVLQGIAIVIMANVFKNSNNGGY